jgi:hypothetical protein
LSRRKFAIGDWDYYEARRKGPSRFRRQFVAAGVTTGMSIRNRADRMAAKAFRPLHPTPPEKGQTYGTDRALHKPVISCATDNARAIALRKSESVLPLPSRGIEPAPWETPGGEEKGDRVFLFFTSQPVEKSRIGRIKPRVSMQFCLDRLGSIRPPSRNRGPRVGSVPSNGVTL